MSIKNPVLAIVVSILLFACSNDFKPKSSELEKGSTGGDPTPVETRVLKIESFLPAQIPESGGTLTLNGTGFDSTVTIFVGTTACFPVTLINSRQLTCVLAGVATGDQTILLARRSDGSSVSPAIKIAILPPSERACFISNGVGKETLISGTSNYGACTATSCNTDYTLHQNACHANSRPCNIDHGTGRETFNNGTYEACKAISCVAEFTLFQGACYANKRSCTIANGSGEQSFSSGSYGACSAISCNNDYSLFQGACYASKRSCTIANGTGEQSFSSGSYGTCSAISCNNDYSLFQGACYQTRKSCTVDNGSGYQDFSGGSYGTCVATACSTGYFLKAGACLVRPANFPSAFVTACPPTIPKGQLTVLDIGAFYVSRITVSDGSQTIAEKECQDTGSCTLLLEIKPEQTTKYQVRGISSVIDVDQEITITVLDSSDPAFKMSAIPLTASPHPSGSGYNFSWSNTDTQIQRYLVIATDALGSKVFTRGYSAPNAAALNTYAHNPMIQTTYTLMACKGGYFKPELAEIATLTLKPPQPSLAPVVGLQAECLGVARFEASGKQNYFRLYGGGNINSTQPAATINACREFMQTQQMLCNSYYGPTCKVFGYYYSKDPKTDLTGSSDPNKWGTVLYRIFTGGGIPPLFPMSSAGACNVDFWREDGSSVSPGNQRLVSASEAELKEDCENHQAYSFLEISALAAAGSPKLIGPRNQTLVNLISNEALINKTTPK